MTLNDVVSPLKELSMTATLKKARVLGTSIAGRQDKQHVSVLN